jgi:Na+/H+-dicarboxylate symporter
MKVWIKLLIGAVLGILLGRFLPNTTEVREMLLWLESFAIQLGRYTVIPVMLFSVTIAVYELRQGGQFWSLVFKSLLVLLGIAVFIISSGLAITLLFPPARIPILIEEQSTPLPLDPLSNISDLFPSNMFSVFVSDGIYLFPVCVCAFFIGIGLSYDRTFTKPVIALIDSCSRIFYHIAYFFSEILGIVIIVLAASWSVRFYEMITVDAFLSLAIFLIVVCTVLTVGVLPLLLYIFKPKSNPWAVLYASFSTALASFFSGDINFTIPVLFLHAKESLGVRRRSNSISISLFTTFGRAGSALVALIAFIVIVKSYSSLGIRTIDICTLALRALLLSFLLARYPGSGAYSMLIFLCTGYGRGFEAGYLILKPFAFYLIALGTFMDMMIAFFATFALGKMYDMQEEKNVREFI